ncbi:MAG: DegV family protein [Clostridiales bacterium]|nr:DegV family EDD domain-containing protein [Eubacteriales bacterium]MDH7567708.1 DegV family protein [Clostridiales bacterium]
MPIKRISGKRIYYAFLSGAREIIRQQDHLNKLNVFPVPDSDTGTNLASTMRSMIEGTVISKCVKDTMKSIANSALTGSRGNSGIILSQFFYGLSAELKKGVSIDTSAFGEAALKAVSYSYKAISHPVEGTIITVMREWAECVNRLKEKTDDFDVLLPESLKAARESLINTTRKLKSLESAGVVDAGAKGFVSFIEGIVNFILHGRLRELKSELPESVKPGETVFYDTHENFNYRYCTEALIEGKDIDKDELLKDIKGFGDSVIVAGTDSNVRVHVHTNTPAQLLFHLKRHGRALQQKVDDMEKQNVLSKKAKQKIALVTDSTCDLPRELLDFYQISIVPLTIIMQDGEYLDGITINPESYYKMLDEQAKYPNSSQPSEISFRNLYSFLCSHFDSVISIHLSGGMSGTLNAARLAAEKVNPGKITVIDSRCLTGALGLIVLRAAQAIDDGKTHEEVVKLTEEYVESTKIYVGVNSIKFLVMRGRLSPWKGFFANLLGIRPIVSIDGEGKAFALGKSFSSKGTLKKITSYIKDAKRKKPIWKYVIMHANNPKMAEIYKKALTKTVGAEPAFIMDAAPSASLNTGAQAVAVAFMYE